MFEIRKNSIIGVDKAKDKLQKAIVKKYPSTKDSKYEIGIDPRSGRYTIVVFLSDPAVFKRLPPTVNGYKVLDGFKPVDLNEGLDDARP